MHASQTLQITSSFEDKSIYGDYNFPLVASDETCLCYAGLENKMLPTYAQEVH